MADIDNLILARSQITAIIVQITASPKPSYSIDGQSFSWGEYLAILLAQIKNLDEVIAATSTPFFSIGQVVTG